MMSPALMRFVFSFVTEGTLKVCCRKANGVHLPKNSSPENFLLLILTNSQMSNEQCPWEISPLDAYLSLDYFGFPAHDLDIKPSDDDPNKLYKAMEFANFKKTRQTVPLLLDFIKKIIQDDSSGSSGLFRSRSAGYRGFHFIVSVPIFS